MAAVQVLLLAISAVLAVGLLIVGVLYLYLRAPALEADEVQHDEIMRREPSPEVAECNRLIVESQENLRRLQPVQRIQQARIAMDTGFRGRDIDYEQQGIEYREFAVGHLRGEWVLTENSDPDERLLYLHGGAFVAGSHLSHRPITATLARVSGCAVLVVDYRLMPEHKRLSGISDAQLSYRWLLENGPQGAVKASRIFIAGDSAGGNLTLMLAAWCRDQQLRPADAIIGICPSTDSTLLNPSIRSNRATDLLLGSVLAALVSIPKPAYLISSWLVLRRRPNDPIVSPLLGDLRNLPPTLLQASQCEMLLDDSLRYASRARQVGSDVTLQLWPGLPHVWHIFVPRLPEAREAMERIGEFIQAARGRNT
ncbi:MAG: alpha/beta hydrolase [Planctomycetales bacterium]|nr:alpha/beta hydrolase [Planctomycetales bacterium]